MTNKPERSVEELKEDGRFAVYENDGELVADWWIEKIQAEHQRCDEMVKAEREKLDN